MLVTVATIVWLLAVTYLALTVSKTFVPQLRWWFSVAPEAKRAFLGLLGTLLIAVAATTAIGLWAPSWWRRAVMTLILVPTIVLLYTSANIAAGATALALVGTASWVGRELVARLLPRVSGPDAWAIGSTAGIGLLALLGLATGRVGLLRTQVLWPIVLGTLLVLLVARASRLRAGTRQFHGWLVEPVVTQPTRFLWRGTLLGYFWINLVGALAPEILSDAIRQRLATARYFASIGRLAADTGLHVSATPGVGELVYAVALASGPLQTAKVLNLLVGMACALGVWTLARHFGGNVAGEIAAIAFYTLPVTVWLSQTAYVDLFATLFAITTMLLIALHMDIGWRCLPLVGLCTYAGLRVKESYAMFAVGSLVAVSLTIVVPALRKRNTLSAIIALLALILLLEVVVLGTLRSGRDFDALLVDFRTSAGYSWSVGRAKAAIEKWNYAAALYSSWGSGHSIWAFIRSPFSVTVHSSQYGEVRDGFAGYLVLALAPFTTIVAARPSRRSLAILAGALAAFVAWFYTAQYLRYALPMFAILCVLGGWGYGVVRAQFTRAAARVTGDILLVVLAGFGLVGYFNTPWDWPYRVAIGQVSASTYLAEKVSGYTALSLLATEPQANLVACYECAQLYSRARTRNVTYSGSYQTERDLLDFLNREGYTHVLVDRMNMPPGWDSYLLLDEEFLRRNAVLVGGDHSAYLYRLVPPNQQGHDQQWARGSELLKNGGFEEAQGRNPATWQSFGTGTYERAIGESRTGLGAVRVPPYSGYSTEVKVKGGVPYLLTEAMRSDKGYGSAQLWIDWFDDANRLVGRSQELVPVSPRGYYVRSMLSTASPTATKAKVYVEAIEGTIWFDDVSFRSIPPDDLGNRTDYGIDRSRANVDFVPAPRTTRQPDELLAYRRPAMTSSSAPFHGTLHAR